MQFRCGGLFSRHFIANCPVDKFWKSVIIWQRYGLSQSGTFFETQYAWMSDDLQTGKPFRYIANTKVNSAFHPFGVGKLSTSLSGCGKTAWHVYQCWVAGDTVWSHMAGDAP